MVKQGLSTLIVLEPCISVFSDFRLGFTFSETAYATAHATARSASGADETHDLDCLIEKVPSSQST
jgi:hypothetical protein